MTTLTRVMVLAGVYRQEAVGVLERIAKDPGRPANELDWSIWEKQRKANR